MFSFWYVLITIFLVVVVQVPIAVDLLRFLFPQWKISRTAGNFVHYVLFACMSTIFCIGISYHIFIYLPLIVPDPLYSIWGWLHLLFALWLWINMIGNYYHVVNIHPGQRKNKSKSLTKDEAQILGTKVSACDNQQDLSESSDGEESMSIGKAQPTNGLEWLPKDTHYCPVCECSVLLVDHHCPFTGSCAGLYNYSHFFIGMVYGSVGLLYAVVLTAPYFWECNLKLISWYIGLVQNRTVDEKCEELDFHSQIFIPVFSGYLVISTLLALQIIFLLSDLSTYNILIHWSKYPMIKFMRDRIRGKKFLDKDSRLNVLILNQRPNIWWYLLPVSRHQIYKQKQS